MDETLLSTFVSNLHGRLIFRFFFWLRYFKGCKSFVARVVYQMPCFFHGVNLDGTDCQNFIVVIVATVLNRVDNFSEAWLCSSRLPMISIFTTFSTLCTVSWAFVPRELFSAVATEFPFFFLTNGINTPIFLTTFNTSW